MLDICVEEGVNLAKERREMVGSTISRRSDQLF